MNIGWSLFSLFLDKPSMISAFPIPYPCICCQRDVTEQIDSSFLFCQFLLSFGLREKKTCHALAKNPMALWVVNISTYLTCRSPWLKRNPPTAPTLPQPKMPRPWRSRPCRASREWIRRPMRSGCRRCRPNRLQHNSCTCSRLQLHQVECSLDLSRVTESQADRWFMWIYVKPRVWKFHYFMLSHCFHTYVNFWYPFPTCFVFGYMSVDQNFKGLAWDEISFEAKSLEALW